MHNDNLTYAIIGCAMKVHNTLGNGFQEIIYQRCLAKELHRANVRFQREVEHTIYYDGIDVGLRRADFVVENRLVIELKAVFELEATHLMQTKNYLIAYGFQKGLLINFGFTSLQYKLIFNNNKNYQAGQLGTELSGNAT